MSRDRISALAARLGGTAVFAALDPDGRAHVARAGVRRRLRRGQTLFRRGAESDSLALVLSGRLDVTRYTERGEALVFRYLGPGALVGLSTVAGARHTADVVAGEPSEILAIPGSVLRALIARSPDFSLRAIVHLATLLGELSDEVEDLRVYDLEERVRRRLLRLGKGRREIRITHAELAAQVGATRANVSRALERLERRNLVRRHRGRIELV